MEKIAIVVFLLSFLDLTLTHYQLFLDKKFGVYDLRIERNPIAKAIMMLGKKESYPINYIYGAIWSIGVIFTMIFYLNLSFFDYGIIIGMLFTVNIYHSINLRDVMVNYHNNSYLELKRKIRKITR